MAIDFGNPESRKSFLQASLDEMLDGIHETYTSALMDELVARLERTVNDFNNEVRELMELLKAKSEKKEDFLKKIKTGEVGEKTKAEEKLQRKLSVWERKLEAMDKS